MNYPKPSQPKHFNDDERRYLHGLLEDARSSITPYNGSWKADWLITDIHAPVWLLRTHESRKVHDKWRRVLPIRWDVQLEDQNVLTDSENDDIRCFAQKAAFLVRLLPSMGVASPIVLQQWIGHELTIIQWLFRNKPLYDPQKHLLSLVDTAAIIDFIRAVSAGGKAWAMQIPQRVLQLFYRQALGNAPPPELLADPYRTPNDDKLKINAWLEDANLYCTKNTNRGWNCRYIDRAKLADKLSCSWQELKSDKINAFLRQFEPELTNKNPHLLIPIGGVETEYLGHWTPTINDVAYSLLASPALVAYANVWRNLMRLRRHLPDALPSTDTIAWSKVTSIIKRESREIKHVPWVPLEIALAYTTEALRWVIKWSEPLVSFYISAIEEFTAQGWFNHPTDTPKTCAKKCRLRDHWILANTPDSLSELNIGGWTTVFSGKRKDVFPSVRKHPSLNDALQVLVGATAVLIGITKPIRESELRMLQRDCLRFVQGDGYWLDQPHRKVGVNGIPVSTTRPVPTVTAKAIVAIQRLGNAMAQLTDDADEYARQLLFYIPIAGRNGSPRPRHLPNAALHSYLNRFCDYVSLPPDSFGRRWYIRIHELRKSFLITFFWCFKYSSLEAARWIAGHGSAEHIYAYIQANFPGEELPHLEAEYAAQQLWNFTHSGLEDSTDNVEGLHLAVCEHFRVTEINLINETELMEWLELAFAKGSYRIEPYEFSSADGLVKVSVAFRISNDGSG